MQPNLSPLIQRLEKADGPSRELDAEIRRVVLGSIAQNVLQFSAERDGSVSHYNESGQRVKREAAPSYTSSIDAALTLVPEDRNWTLAKTCCVIGELRAGGIGNSVHTAIAICIAALRAQQREG